MNEHYEPQPSQMEQATLRIPSDFTTKDGAHPLIEVSKEAPALLLFDIDGTLINAKTIHGSAVLELYQEVFPDLPWQQESFCQAFKKAWFDGWGPGDRLEHEKLCELYNLLPSDEQEKQALLDRLVYEYGEKMSRITRAATPEQKNKMILPGVIALLDEMRTRKIPAAIVTGNIRKSAEELLKNLELSEYFIAGGFDDDPEVTNEPYRRANILQSAITKCAAKGIHFPPERTLVFGDTPKDHWATLHNKTGRPYTFLVATGDHPFHKLTEVSDKTGTQRPHRILNNLARLNLPKFFNSLSEIPPTRNAKR